MPTIPPGTRTPIDDDGDGTIDRIEFDFDGDGTIDRTVHLNADGRWERVERDDDDDGTIDRTVYRNTDGSGTLNRIDFDDDGDGTTDRSVFYTHNADNNRTRTGFDDDGDGTTDRSEDYIYNSIGTRTRTNFDDNNDGTTDRSEDYSYFNGRLSRTRFDDNEDSTFDRSETYTYDENGNRIRTEFDDDADGTAARIIHYTFDDDGNGRVTRRDADLDDDGNIDRTVHVNADGRWERVERDDDDDGNIDRIDHFAFDDDGTRSLTRRDFDRDDDGNIDRIDHFAFDDDGTRSLTRRDFDRDDDGTIDRTVHRNTDGSDTLNRIDFDDDGDGTTDRSQFYTHNPDNNRNRTTFDDDGDDTIDRSETYTYDANDRVSQTRFDDDNDSTTDRIETYTYDDDGNRTRTRFDDDNDGTTDRSEAQTYDANGNRNRTDFDDDEDGTTDRSETYTLDESGNRIQTDFDDDNDGTTNRSESYTYDANGRVSQTDFDDDNDGTTDRSETYTYSANGRVSRTGFDDGNDGTTDRSETYAYYGNGRVSQTRFDDSNDGTTDRIETYTYDGNGRVSQTRFDDDGDGTTDRSETYTYDVNGRVSQTAFDTDGDGTTDRSETYTYNDDGNRNRTSFDDDNDGTTDRIETYTYDANGNLIRTEFDDDADSTNERIESYSYDLNGNLSRTAFDDDADSTNDRIESYSYDLNGNLSRTEFDDDADGIIERVENYDLNGNLIRTEIDTDNDGVLDRTEIDLNNDGNPERVEIRNPSGQVVRQEIDNLSDGTPNRVNYYWYPEDLDGDRDPFRQDDDTDGDGDLDRVSYEGDADFAGDFPNHAGLEVVRLGFVGRGDGFTTLTIPDGFVFAGASGSRVRIEGGSTDTLRFDMDDFTEGDRVIIEGQDYRSFAADDGSWSFLVDADVTLIDPIPNFTSPTAASVAENQTAAYMAVATDEDSGILVYSLSGTDAALFTINANTGAVSFIAAPDFEAPGDDDRDNVYDIIVTASDGENNTNHNVAITVTNENDNIPVFTSPATANVRENQVAAYETAVTDADGDTLVYSLSGTDSTLFTINANTGEVRFRAAPDFEAPGDDGGDNVYDITVTASDGTTDTEQAVAITVTDVNEFVPLSSLDGSNGFILNGIDGGDSSGFSVSSAGDVNGDGYDDLIIGARYAGPNGVSRAGESYVVYGGASAPGTGGVLDLSDLDGTNGFILNGIDANDFSGWSVSSAGDVNGDGYDDLIIGARWADPNGDSYAGESYVIYGGANAPGTGGVLDLSDLDGSNGFTLTGIDARDRSGVSVSSAGDVNGDGYDDLIIGAYYGANRAGETYIVYGGASAPGTDGVLDLSALDGTNGFILSGIDAADQSGFSVSSAGDVNGDGYDDLVIGARNADPNGSNSGETYVVYGGASAPGTGGVLNLGALDGSNGFILNGIDANDASGWSVSSAGDVNGDGYDDLIIGAQRADPNGNGSGETYVVYGGASAPGTDGVLDLSALDGTNGFILNGIDANDNSGISVSSAGDINGDGYDDLIIGANRADPNGINLAGETYVIYGGANAPGTAGVLDLSDLDGNNGFTLAGIGASDLSGRSVSAAGDVNGDGYDDLVIGAPGGFSETYVIYGGATGTESLTPVTAQGTAAADNFTGNAGADSFTAIATDDVVRGGAGNDRISVTALDFAAIDGGTGADTLVLDGAGLALDLTGTGHAGVDSVEVFDLSGTGANSLVLDAQAVFDVTEEREGGVARLDVLGDADDRVDLSGSNFALSGTATEDGVTYNVYRDGNAQLRIEDGVQVQNPRLITLSVAEGQIAARYRAPDVEGETLVYSLSGADAALFTIDANTGAVRFREVPDFEAPGDADGDNVYDIIATVSDGTTETEQAVAIRVTNENDNIPVFTSPATANAAENQFAAYEAAATDADGDTLVYSLSGTDAARFTIDANTGAVRFRAAPDFEAPGDDGGDNVYDIVVTASDGSNHTEQAVAITVTDGYDLDLAALDGSNGFILNGIDAADYSGRSVSSAGDVNGDGYDDLIIGARSADPNGESSGETYVVYGGANAPGMDGVLDLSALDGTNGFILTGIGAYDRSGWSVSSAGDVNGDGYDDLIIGASYAGGASYADPYGNGSGETYIVYGGASAPGREGVLDLSALDGTNGFILNGNAGDYSGWSVSSAGDVNGDGYDDLVIGAYWADSQAGKTYVVYGGASAPGTDGMLDLSDLDGTNGFILTGIDRGDLSGYSVSSAGDVNGDGYDDLVIGARDAAQNRDGDVGETYVIYGGASAPGSDGVLDLSALDGSNGFILNGIDANDRSGWSVSSAGDVNGDGYDDLIIGAWQADPNGESSGESYVIYGGASAPGTNGELDLSALDGSNGFIVNGIDANDNSGISVSSAGDVNGDGYDDLIIGARFADPNGRREAGETYIVYGGASAPGSDGVLDLSSLALDGSTGFIVNGGAYDYSGRSVSSAGDVNGDGYDDLVIGAYSAGSSGETYLVYGGATGTESLTPVTATGTAAADNFTGNAGADSFTEIATDDVVRGGAGDDRISVTALDFAAIDGGTGVDTLVLDGAGLALDLTGPGNAGVDSVEVFDLSGTGANSLVLDARAVFDVTEEREGGVARLDVLGDADDSVDLSGSNFALAGTGTEDGVTYHVYRDGNAQLRIEDGVQVQNPRLITLSVAENQIAARYRAPDVAGETLVYSLSGADAALFTIDANTGEVRFREAPDFEAPGDADGDNVYDIIATVSDGTTDTEQAVAIRVTNENDNAPVFTSPARVDAAENQFAAYEAAATDADGDTLVYSLSGTDAALFTIDADRGEVRFREAPDFEMPGDDGGDNVYDIVVTASDGSNHTEQAVAITVTDGYDPDLASLDGSNGFIVNGIDGGDQSGYSVSSAGDVNGDGYDDLIIGAHVADPNGRRSAGETYVVYGGASAPGTGGRFNLSDLDGSNGFILNGIDFSDFSGFSVSSAGDVNGDGYDDLVIGAFSADPNGDTNAGETYVVYGVPRAPGTDGVLDLSTLDGTNGFILTGVDGNDRSGASVSSAGDVNGDGYDDLIIGADRAAPNGRSSAGETYVVYGGANAPGTGGVLALGALDGTNGFILNGIDATDASGHSVSSAGDVNGDGYDDLVIGATGAAGDAGETYVVYGGASAPGSDGMLDLSTLDGSNGFILTGIDAVDRSGWSVSSAGDVNGDGYDDLIIGARYADPNGNSSGESYVVYGGASAPGTGGVLDLSDLDGSNGFIVNGIDENDESGFSVSSAGDVNGDGYDDLIIGARRADPNGRNNAGESYVVYGGASAPGSDGVLDLSSLVLDGSTGFIVNGIDANNQSGRSVSSAGDVNGDGYDDLVIGAFSAAPAGESYVIYGGATGTESLMPVTAQGTAAADNFTGNAGADSFTAIATDDVVRGGAGDDRISVTALDFAAIDGGTGVDTLVLDGAGLALDLTGAGHAGVDSVEVFDLSGTGANSLVLDALAVFDVTEEREDGLASLDVLGDADDRVDLGGGNFILTGTVTEDGVTYNVYRDGNAQLRIEDGVSVTLAAAGAQSARSLTADPDRILPDLSHADAREGIDGTGLYSPGHSPGMDVDFMDGFSEPEFEWTGVVVTGLAPPDMQAPGPLSSGQAINLFDVLTGTDLSYDLLL